MPPPPIDLEATASALRIVARAGCDLSPLDPTRAEDQLTLLSYIWPDELHRIDRMRAALSVAERNPVPVAARRASEWLPEVLADGRDGELTVVWHSVMRQYVEPDEWAAIERALERAPGSRPPEHGAVPRPAGADAADGPRSGRRARDRARRVR